MMMRFKLLYFISILLISCSTNKNSVTEINKIPIIYSEKYNIKLFGLQKLHPFDTEKPEKIYNYLKEHFSFENEQFYEPSIILETKLLEIHSAEYLKSLKKSRTIAKIAEMYSLAFLPSSLLEMKMLRPMKFATGGTILGVDVAIKHGFAFNLSGGYHHAKANSGEGFCFFADINFAVKELKEKHSITSIMIIDLDAHQGNGHESIAKSDTNVHIFDVYNENIYPNDNEVKQYIDFNFPIPKYCKDEQYLKIINEELPKAIKKSKPKFIIYNAGTDIYKGDLLGSLSITKEGIIKRDEIVFENAIENNIPILFLLSGGYSKKSAKITAESIENLIKKYLK